MQIPEWASRYEHLVWSLRNMDKVQAQEIAERELEFYRRQSYKEIAAKRGTQESFERTSENGERYQIEFDCHDDDSESGNIRVSAAVSYSGWTDFFPVSSDFIVAPDGSFIGE